MGPVIGKAVRALRAARAWSQEDVARGLTVLGLPWARSQVAELETGRRDDLNVGELLVLAELFNVRLANLVDVAGEDRIGLVRKDRADRSRAYVIRLLSGEEPLDPGLYGPEEQPGLGEGGPYWTKTVGRTAHFYSALEVRTALTLGVYAEDISEASRARWGRPMDDQLTEELEGTNAQDWPAIEGRLVDDLGSSRELAEQVRRKLR